MLFGTQPPRLAASSSLSWRRKSIHRFLLLALLVAAARFATPAPAQTIEWIRQFGTSGSDSVLGVASDGISVYVVGYTRGTFPGQVKTGTSDAFVRKYDSDGNEV